MKSKMVRRIVSKKGRVYEYTHPYPSTERKKTEHHPDFKYKPHPEKHGKGHCLKRDNFQCVLCGSKNSLQVHHVDLKGAHKTSHPNNKLSNLMTLCIKCHHKIHRKEQAKGTYSRNVEILKLRQAGLTLVDIGRQYNITRQRVEQIVNDQSTYEEMANIYFSKTSVTV